LLNDLADGSVLHVWWTGYSAVVTKPDGMTFRVQRRVALALVNSGRLNQLKYDGRLRDRYALESAA